MQAVKKKLMENKFEMVAKTFQGLEDVLRDELISLGAENVELGRRIELFASIENSLCRKDSHTRKRIKYLFGSFLFIKAFK